MSPYFEYSHIVGFAETNLVGNVYYVHYLHWQGRCREMFLLEHCPELIAELSDGFALVTTRCGCEYLAELYACDQVSVRMRLVDMRQNRVTMGFEYWRLHDGAPPEMIARGEQQIACMRRQASGEMSPTPVPESFRVALEAYAA